MRIHHHKKHVQEKNGKIIIETIENGEPNGHNTKQENKKVASDRIFKVNKNFSQEGGIKSNTNKTVSVKYTQKIIMKPPSSGKVLQVGVQAGSI